MAHKTQQNLLSKIIFTKIRAKEMPSLRYNPAKGISRRSYIHLQRISLALHGNNSRGGVVLQDEQSPKHNIGISNFKFCVSFWYFRINFYLNYFD